MTWHVCTPKDAYLEFAGYHVIQTVVLGSASIRYATFAKRMRIAHKYSHLKLYVPKIIIVHHLWYAGMGSAFNLFVRQRANALHYRIVLQAFA